MRAGETDGMKLYRKPPLLTTATGYSFALRGVLRWVNFTPFV